MKSTTERTIRARYLRLIDDRARLAESFKDTRLRGEQHGWSNAQMRLLKDLDERIAQTRRHLVALTRMRVTA